MRKLALTVALVGMSAATGVGISMIPHGASTPAVVLLALVTGSVAFTPVVRRLIRRDLNVFEPIIGGAMTLGVLFSVRPLWMISPSHAIYFGRDTRPHLPWALFVAAAGVCSFVLAYELISRRPLPRRAERAQQRFDSSTLALSAVFVGTLSVGLYALYLGRAGSVMAGLRR